MGIETATLIATAAGGAYNAYEQHKANKANTQGQQNALAAQQQQNALVRSYVDRYLNQGPNPYAQQISSMFGFQPPRMGGQPQGLNLGGDMPGFGPAPGPARPVTGLIRPDLSIQTGQGDGGGGGAGGSAFMLPSGPGFTAPQTVPGATYNPAQALLPPGVVAPQIDLSGFRAGTQGFNTGQDALTQALRRGPQVNQGPGLSALLGGIAGGGTQYNASPLFGALNAQDQMNLQDQLSQLTGSFGSFGQRLGTGAMNAQGQLRQQFLTNAAVRNQQIGQSSFESAQGRALQAAGLLGQNLQAGNAANLGAFQAQTGAAQGLAGLGLNQAQLLAQLAQSNQGAGLQARLANQGLAGQYGLANMAALNSAGQFNAGQLQNAGMFNQQMGQQWNQFMLGGLGQAAGLQQAQNGQNISLLSLLAGLPMGQIPQLQPGQYGQSLSDLGTLGLIYGFLGNRPGGGGGLPNPGSYTNNGGRFG